jgi:5'-methylthioadenosine phosphorylase
VGIAFLPRHGKGHRLSPTEVPYRANIYALKSLGVGWIISVSAVGSLKEALKPGDLAIPDQLIDRTRSRVNSFFNGGIVAHILFAEPFCPVLSQVLFKTAKEIETATHRGSTYLVMEGPAFSTRAESRLYRSWGASLIGMTALPETKLAREAEICYATIAGITDYDCWQESYTPFSIDAILDTQRQQIKKIREIIRLAISRIPDNRECECATALKTAIVTDPKLISHEQRAKLKLLIGNYIK